MIKEHKALNDFMVSCFYSILAAEEKALESISNGKLSLKEIHVIEAVFKARENKKDSFSDIANILGVTFGTLTTAFLRLEKKGYLIKERDKTDKRVFHILPTRLAEMVNSEHTAWHQKLVDGVIKTVPEKDLEGFVATFKDLSEFIRSF